MTTMETMSIHRALSELKTLNERIAKAINRSRLMWQQTANLLEKSKAFPSKTTKKPFNQVLIKPFH